MNFLCGPWGGKKCSAQRWFDYMGSIKNGFSPFNVIFKFSKAKTEDYTPLKPALIPCDHRNAEVGI